jgi:hypothetical protein
MPSCRQDKILHINVKKLNKCSVFTDFYSAGKMIVLNWAFSYHFLGFDEVNWHYNIDYFNNSISKKRNLQKNIHINFLHCVRHSVAL